MNIAIIGLGTMGAILAERLSGHQSLYLYDRHFAKAQQLQEKGYGMACQCLEEAADKAELILLAVKPQSLTEAAEQLTPLLTRKHILVSILAGTPLATLRTHLIEPRIIRLMPNLPMRCGAGVIGLTMEGEPSPGLQQLFASLCDHLGAHFWLSEDKFDAFTALAGSGPAFVFSIVEAMIDAAVAMGLSALEGKEIAIAMTSGSLALLQNTSETPSELCRQVASPAGTTIEGLRVMEQRGLRSDLIETFMATFERAKQLNKR